GERLTAGVGEGVGAAGPAAGVTPAAHHDQAVPLQRGELLDDGGAGHAEGGGELLGRGALVAAQQHLAQHAQAAVAHGDRQWQSRTSVFHAHLGRGRRRGLPAVMARFVNVVASRVNPRAVAVPASGYARQVATACGRIEAPEHLRIATVVGPGGPVRTKAQYVYESLREDILQGRLRPGARLVFSQVASRFGVSPIPVREAVRQLETEGLVELKPHTRVE